MTIEQEAYRPTESLILPSPRTFYPANIPVHHPQLRCLIGLPTSDTIYYASDGDLVRLDLSPRRREVIASIPFSPHCLAAGHGWLCAGGRDNGQFAAVRIDEELDHETTGDAHPDPTTTSHLDSESQRQGPRFSLRHEGPSGLAGRSKSEPQLRDFRGLTMNSITLFQPAEGSDDAADGPIAVLSNNDKTVKLFSLAQQRLFADLEFPYPMNHASIRPDGQALVAVGDDAYVFVYRRVRSKDRSLAKRAQFRPPATVSWNLELVQRYELPRAPHPTDDHLFATAFSPSGQYCAVASQGGIATIFDAQRLCDPDQDPVIEQMSSSRPHERYSKDGAFRSMCFSPAPWDLLICVEQHQRVCVFDLRTGFRLRQVLTLDHRAADVERAEIFSHPRLEDDIDPSLRNPPEWTSFRQYRDAIAADEAAMTQFAMAHDEVEASEGRRVPELAEPFTARERHLLEALRTSRERLDTRDPSTTTPQVNTSREARAIAQLLDPGPPMGTQSTSSSSTAIPAVRNHFRERNAERDDRRTQPYDPRRRGSVVLTPTGPGLASTMAELPEPTRTLTPPRMPDVSNDAWRTIEAVFTAPPYTLAGSGSGSGDRPATGPNGGGALPPGYQVAYMELERLNHHRWMRLGDRQRRVRNLQAEIEGFQRYPPDVSGREDNEMSLGTTGCCMSRDGRRLYIGTEGGIFEFAVNLQHQKHFPSVFPR
ncbi:MAG: hypothetical protein M1823_000043 [Watsoniomyces obsoletus]|nr:MAG: hypothetical protein M1823_000043 [Watsoniomyces obsoletus]